MAIQLEQLGDNQYRLLHVSPGAHSVGECRAPITLTTEAGKNYYVCIKLVSGGFIREASYRVQILGDQEGRDLVLQSRLAGKRH